jgi:Fe-S-cluster-containing dehydrogenase component
VIIGSAMPRTEGGMVWRRIDSPTGCRSCIVSCFSHRITTGLIGLIAAASR